VLEVSRETPEELNNNGTKVLVALIMFAIYWLKPTATL